MCHSIQYVLILWSVLFFISFVGRGKTELHPQSLHEGVGRRPRVSVLVLRTAKRLAVALRRRGPALPWRTRDAKRSVTTDGHFGSGPCRSSFHLHSCFPLQPPCDCGCLLTMQPQCNVCCLTRSSWLVPCAKKLDCWFRRNYYAMFCFSFPFFFEGVGAVEVKGLALCGVWVSEGPWHPICKFTDTWFSFCTYLFTQKGLRSTALPQSQLEQSCSLRPRGAHGQPC